MGARTLTAERSGPVLFEFGMAYGSIRVIVAGDTAEMTLTTPDDADSPTGKAVAEATMQTYSGRVVASVPLPKSSTSVAHGSGVYVSNTGGGVTVIGDAAGDVYMAGGQVFINGQRVTPNAGGPIQSGRISAEVRLPEGSSLKVLAISADVETVGELVEVECSTTSGDLTVEACQRLTFDSKSGDVRAEVADRATVRTVSGDVRLGRTESVHATTTSGDLTLGDFGGNATLTTVSGDIRVHATEGGSLVTSTVSGDISVTAPDALVLKNVLSVKTNTISGRVRVPQPHITVPSGRSPRGPRFPS
jgi:hypothetical protein